MGFSILQRRFALLYAGADAIKFFPSEVLGIPMLKALLAVLPKTAIVIPVGGIDANKIAPWMSAGALGVGAGSSIYKPGDDVAIVEAKAKASHGCRAFVSRYTMTHLIQIDNGLSRHVYLVDEPNLHWPEDVASVYAQAEANLRTSVSFRQHAHSLDVERS
jgi:hypothetical protein